MKDNNWQRVEEIFHKAIGMRRRRKRVRISPKRVRETIRCAQKSNLCSRHSKIIKTSWINLRLSLGLKMMSGELKEESLEGKLIGPYKILKLLGKGGMGKVYLAEDTKLDRKVALKFLSGKLTDDAWARRQLIKEAQAVAKLNHPNICILHDLEEHDGYIFMVMQYIEGETLAALISKKLLESKRVLRLAVQIVSALAEAQSHDILHRDIKPQNIMVTADGQAKVLDFGLAKLIRQKQGAADSESQSLTIRRLVPEPWPICRQSNCAPKKSIFAATSSAWIVLYEMISGGNPYLRASNAEIISAILTSDPQPLKDLDLKASSRDGSYHTKVFE